MMNNLFHCRAVAINLILPSLKIWIPLVKSIEAIRSHDTPAMRKYLVYWLVITLFHTLAPLVVFLWYSYVLLNCNSFTSFLLFISAPPKQQYTFPSEAFHEYWIYQLFNALLPEFQIIFIILFQRLGCEWIYNSFIEQLFLVHRVTIERVIETITNKLMKLASQHFSRILWSLILSPDEGILSAIVSFFRNNVGDPFSAYYAITGTDTHDCSNSTNTESTGDSNKQALQLGKQILRAFTSILSGSDGITLRIQSQSTNADAMQYYRCRLLPINPNYLYLSPLDDDDFMAYAIPLLLLKDIIFEDLSDAKVVRIEFADRIPKCKGLETDAMVDHLRILVDTTDDADALLSGMQVLSSATRTTAMRIISCAVQRLDAARNRRRICNAFWCLRNPPTSSDFIDTIATASAD